MNINGRQMIIYMDISRQTVRILPKISASGALALLARCRAPLIAGATLSHMTVQYPNAAGAA